MSLGCKTCPSRFCPFTGLPGSPLFPYVARFGLRTAWVPMHTFPRVSFLLSHGPFALCPAVRFLCPLLLVIPNCNRAMREPRRPAVSLWLVSPLCLVSVRCVPYPVRVWLCSLGAAVVLLSILLLRSQGHCSSRARGVAPQELGSKVGIAPQELGRDGRKNRKLTVNYGLCMVSSMINAFISGMVVMKLHMLVFSSVCV